MASAPASTVTMAMTKAKERQLMRLIHGELSPDEARRLQRELEIDSELSAAHRRLARAWDGLELPASEPPAGFSTGVLAAARELSDPRAGVGGELSWSLAPAWARGGAAAALVVGLLLGASFGRGFEVGAGSDETAIVAEAEADALPLSLAEVYWLALEESGGELAGGDVEAIP